MGRSNNWPAYGGEGVQIDATNVSARTALPTRFKGCQDILVENPGPLTVRIKALQADAGDAALLSVPVLPGTVAPFALGGCMFLAVIVDGGSAQSIKVHPGEGA